MGGEDERLSLETKSSWVWRHLQTEARWPHKPLLTTLSFQVDGHRLTAVTPALSAFRNATLCFKKTLFLLWLPWTLLFLQTGNRDWNSPNRIFQFCLNWWVRWGGLNWIINENKGKELTSLPYSLSAICLSHWRLVNLEEMKIHI